MIFRKRLIYAATYINRIPTLSAHSLFLKGVSHERKTALEKLLAGPYDIIGVEPFSN